MSVAETTLEDLNDRSILIANNETMQFFLPPLAAQFIRDKRQEMVSRSCEQLIISARKRLVGQKRKGRTHIFKDEASLIVSAFYWLMKTSVIPEMEKTFPRNALKKEDVTNLTDKKMDKLVKAHPWIITDYILHLIETGSFFNEVGKTSDFQLMSKTFRDYKPKKISARIKKK